MGEDILNTSISAGLCLVIYTLVDKVVVPLVRKRSRENGRGNSRVQSVLNDQFERRIEGLETDHRALRDLVSAIRADVQETQAILGRIENQISE